MLESIAFQSGVIFVIATSIYSITHCLLARIFNIRIEEVGILYSPFFSINKKRLNKVDLSLGWFPTGSFVKIAGVTNEPVEEEALPPKSYEFRNKPYWMKLIVLLSGPLLLIIIGVYFLGASPKINTYETIISYLKTSLFLIPLEESINIWNELYVNSAALIGFICLVMGIGNLFTNIPALLSSHNRKISPMIWSALFLTILMNLVLLRLTWLNFSMLNIIYFYIASIVTAVVIYSMLLLYFKLFPQR